MKKNSHLMVITLCVIILGACAQATPFIEDEVIDPGDRIGDLLITTGNGDDVIFVTNLKCHFDESTQTESCEQPVGTKVNVSQGILADPNGSSLDEIWSDMTYEMTIEGHPVNLQAFGYVDWIHPMAGTVRVWNVVVVSKKPGQVTARSEGVVGSDPINYTAIIIFVKP